MSHLKNFTVLKSLGKLPSTITVRLGEGAFSTVYLVKRLSDNQLYALKKVRTYFLEHVSGKNGETYRERKRECT